MLISNVHKSIIIVNSIDTGFYRNVLEALQKTCSMCFSPSKSTQLCLLLLNPIIIEHYMTMQDSTIKIPEIQRFKEQKHCHLDKLLACDKSKWCKHLRSISRKGLQYVLSTVKEIAEPKRQNGSLILGFSWKALLTLFTWTNIAHDPGKNNDSLLRSLSPTRCQTSWVCLNKNKKNLQRY